MDGETLSDSLGVRKYSLWLIHEVKHFELFNLFNRFSYSIKAWVTTVILNYRILQTLTFYNLVINCFWAMQVGLGCTLYSAIM